MNPVPVMALIEVIRALQTSDDTFHATMALCERLEKKPVAVNDAPGFISNRVLMPMINEAVFAVMEGIATAESVDTIMKMGMNHPMGPLELADLIGLDTCVNILEVLYNGFGDTKYRALPTAAKNGRGGMARKESRARILQLFRIELSSTDDDWSNKLTDLNPQAKQMAEPSPPWCANLAAQARAIWPQEVEFIRRYALPPEARILDAAAARARSRRALRNCFHGPSFSESTSSTPIWTWRDRAMRTWLRGCHSITRASSN